MLIGFIHRYPSNDQLVENYKANRTWKSYREKLIDEVVKKKKAKVSSKQNRKLKFDHSSNQRIVNTKRKTEKTDGSEGEETHLSQYCNNILKLPPVKKTGASISLPITEKNEKTTHHSFSSSPMLVLPVVSGSNNQFRRCSLTTNVLKNAYR